MAMVIKLQEIKSTAEIISKLFSFHPLLTKLFKNLSPLFKWGLILTNIILFHEQGSRTRAQLPIHWRNQKLCNCKWTSCQIHTLLRSKSHAYQLPELCRGHEPDIRQKGISRISRPRLRHHLLPGQAWSTLKTIHWFTISSIPNSLIIITTFESHIDNPILLANFITGKEMNPDYSTDTLSQTSGEYLFGNMLIMWSLPLFANSTALLK